MYASEASTILDTYNIDLNMDAILPLTGVNRGPAHEQFKMARYSKKKRSYAKRRPRYARRRAPVRRRRTKRYTRRVPRRANILQMPNLTPATTTQKFTYLTRYTVSAASTTFNSKSILAFPVSSLQAPTKTNGAWVTDDTTPFQYPGFDGTAAKYNHAYILGAKITAQIRPASNTNTPSKNLAYLVRTDTIARVGVTTSVVALDRFYGAKSGMYYNDGKEKGITLSMGYSPTKTWGINKGSVRAKSDLKVNCGAGGTGNTGPATDQTYIQIVLGERSESNEVGHDQAIVTVKAEYTVKFVEHKTVQGSGLPEGNMGDGGDD